MSISFVVDPSTIGSFVVDRISFVELFIGSIRIV